MNTTDFLNIATAICPDKEAIVFEDKRYTYSQLSERTNRIAHALLDLGVQKGDRVAMLQVNTSHCVETYFAVAKIAAIYVPLNFRAKGAELVYMLNSCEANTIFIGERYLDLVREIKPELKTVKNFVSLDSKQEDMLYHEDIIAAAAAEDVFSEIGDEDTTILMYTAGTTGFPKGVMLPHSSFSVYVLENVAPADPVLEERNILTVPLYHVAGSQAVMAAIYGGRTLVMERQFEASE